MIRASVRLAAVLALVAFAYVAAVHAAAGVTLPPVERATLANGAQVMLVAKPDTPLVSLTAVVRGGSLGDPAGKEGTASLLADLVQKGAGSRDAAQFAEAVEAAGGQLAVGAGRESLTVTANFLARDVDLMLGLVADVLQRPKLAPADFAKARALAIQSIAAAKDSDPRMLVGTYGNAWLFRGHPYGRPVGGSEATLAAVTLDDVRRYYSSQVGGDRLLLVVVGDIDVPALRQRLEQSFGGWRRASAPVPEASPTQRIQGRRVLLVDKPGATQSYFWLGNAGAARTDPARTAQSVVNTVFGGRFTSMLNTELRIDSGLTYGAASRFDRGRQAGAFSLSSYTQADSTVPAIDLALATLERLHREGLDPAALASSQAYMLGQFPPTLETGSQLSDRLAELALYGLGRDDVDAFADRVAAVDSATARAVIEAAFPQPADLAMVVIGDAARVRESLRKYGPVTEMKLTDRQFAPPASP